MVPSTVGWTSEVGEGTVSSAAVRSHTRGDGLSLGGTVVVDVGTRGRLSTALACGGVGVASGRFSGSADADGLTRAKCGTLRRVHADQVVGTRGGRRSWVHGGEGARGTDSLGVGSHTNAVDAIGGTIANDVGTIASGACSDFGHGKANSGNQW